MSPLQASADVQKPFKASAYMAAERVESSLTYGYFELIGVFTSDEEGIK